MKKSEHVSDLRQRRLQRRREGRQRYWRAVRCYWTWPFGHYYAIDGNCKHCGKHWSEYGA